MDGWMEGRKEGEEERKSKEKKGKREEGKEKKNKERKGREKKTYKEKTFVDTEVLMGISIVSGFEVSRS